MGDQSIKHISGIETRSRFVRHLLNDIRALEILLEEDRIESGITRIGAEQEFCLVDKNWRPTKTAQKILSEIDDPHFTTELALFNLEINLDPITATGDCFSIMQADLERFLYLAREKAALHDTRVLLAGILPTISKNELELEYMTQSPRYWALNQVVKELKGSDFELHILGVDELSIHHDSVLFEACNTSFQCHLQISPDDFVSSYNWAQAITAPILATCSNSPLLLGRDLWAETRIALFQQSIDTRTSSYALKDQQPRVTFGNSWATGTVADLFKHDVVNFNVILDKEIDEDAIESLKKGDVPKLDALKVHNGTVYRWNRPCYGSDGQTAHLRIENRYIPSGPSVLDEMANFAFWVGLMAGRPQKFDDLENQMDFREAKSNFIKAARNGKESVMCWMDQLISVRDLVNKELLPLAHAGLKKIGVDADDVEALLKVIDGRAAGRTGSQWQLANYQNLKKTCKQDDALLALTKTMYDNQLTNTPVHEWKEIDKKTNSHEDATRIGHIMSTEIMTVRDKDLVILAESVMKWQNIHHVPVENKSGEMCGLLTWTRLERMKKEGKIDDLTQVKEVMNTDVVSIRPDTEIKKAIDMMKKLEIGSMPVLSNGHVVGIVTIKDVVDFDN